jgi:vacuolar-type H+-ATPase subunit E/Vma4
VFAHTGGLTGAEVAVAGGTSAVGQRLLEALLGDQAVRSLAARARENLLRRTRAILESEADRYRARIPGAVLAPERRGRLEAALQAVEQAR